jgi:hypothetical protein
MSNHENDHNDRNDGHNDDRYENERDDDRYETNDNDHYYVAPPAASVAPVAVQTQIYNDDVYEANDHYESNDDFRTSPPIAVTPVASVRYAEVDDDYDGQAFRLYMAALDRTPDPSGLASWTNVLRSGTDIDDVAHGFVTSAEFQSSYGSLSDSQYVTQLYQNVLNRAPDASGQANWLAHLEAGESREHVLTGFSESTENRLQAAALVNGVDYQAWVG